MMNKTNLPQIKKEIFTTTNYVGVKHKDLALEKVNPDLFGLAYQKLYKLDLKHGKKYPSAIYYNWNVSTNLCDLAIALSVQEIPENLPNNIELIEIPQTESIYIDYYGLYENMEPVHDMLKQYFIENNLGENYVAIEEYVTDPENEPDSSKWLTKISYLAL